MTHTAAVPDAVRASGRVTVVLRVGARRETSPMGTIPEAGSIAYTAKLARVAPLIARYALVIVFVWFAGLKFTDYEAQGIAPLGENSPFLSWIYHLVSIDTFSQLLGVAELITAVLLALYPLSRRASALGGALATLFFLGTLSFMITTPGIGEASAGGFPVLSATGEFLIKDLGLLGLSVWLLAESLVAARNPLPID
jgi:reactive chlorine resistance protein C